MVYCIFSLYWNCRRTLLHEGFKQNLWTHLYEDSNVIFSKQIRVSLSVYYVGLLPYLSEKWTSKYQILTSIKFSIRNIVSYSGELS